MSLLHGTWKWSSRQRRFSTTTSCRLHAARGLIGTDINGPEDIDSVVELLETRGIELRGEHVALLVAMKDHTVSVTNTAQVRIEESLAAQAKQAALDKSGALSTQAIRAAVAGCQCRLHSPQIGRLKIPQFGAAVHR